MLLPAAAAAAAAAICCVCGGGARRGGVEVEATEMGIKMPPLALYDILGWVRSAAAGLWSRTYLAA